MQLKQVVELPKELTDNEFQYLNLLSSIVEYSSPESEAQVRRNSRGLAININPKHKGSRQELIDTLLVFHRIMGIRIRFSSSLAISNLVQFDLDI